MPTTTVRVTEDTAATLRHLAAETGRSMQDVLASAVEAYSRKLLLEKTNAAYAALRGDEEAWADELAERAAWEATLPDGLEDE